jgi:hypothetical protein
VLAVSVAPGLSVAGNGVRMPTTQLASLEAPQHVADQRPVERVGSERVGSTFLETAPRAPTVPVYKRKQARH